MRKIALVLILFQLIGCAKQPGVITHPENKREQETLQHDTPQAPKTNYLKIGAYIGGVILVSLAIVGIIIAYCCTRKGKKSVTPIDKKEQAKKRAEERAQQDAQDVDRIVQKSSQYIRGNCSDSDIEDNILKTYTNHPIYNGNVELEAILKWFLLLPMPKRMLGAAPGETYLSRQRKYTKAELNKEVERERKANPKMPMSELLAKIESRRWCFINDTKASLLSTKRKLRTSGEYGKTLAPFLMTNITRIVYYYEFKEALLRSK
ncbi:MAG: hypothetical protein LBR09_01210 [Endomicrobium sp.]|jgi:hypothetical protein|nr:hypothetical protein [Endomicrobium sp.]